MRRPGGVAGKGRGRVLAGGDHLRGVRAAARELLIVGKTAAAVHKLSLPGTTRARRWCCRPARGVGVVQVRAGGGGPRGCRLQIGIRARHALRPRRPACRPLHPALWHGLQRVWSSELLWGAAQAARARPPSRQLRVRHAGAPAVAARPDQRPARGFAATSLSGGCVRTGGRSAAIQLLPCAHLAAAAAPAGVWGGEARSSRHPMWRLLTPAGPCSGTPTHQARANLHFHRQAWPHGAGARLRLGAASPARAAFGTGDAYDVDLDEIRPKHDSPYGLDTYWVVPKNPKAVVFFAHGAQLACLLQRGRGCGVGGRGRGELAYAVTVCVWGGWLACQQQQHQQRVVALGRRATSARLKPPPATTPAPPLRLRAPRHRLVPPQRCLPPVPGPA